MPTPTDAADPAPLTPAYALHLARLAGQLAGELATTWRTRGPERGPAVDDAAALVDSCAVSLAAVAVAWGVGGVPTGGFTVGGPFADWSPFPGQAVDRFRAMARRVRDAAAVRLESDRLTGRDREGPPQPADRHADAYALCDSVDDCLLRAPYAVGEDWSAHL